MEDKPCNHKYPDGTSALKKYYCLYKCKICGEIGSLLDFADLKEKLISL